VLQVDARQIGELKVSRTHKMQAIELFSGIGGFRVAADRNGIATVWANDLSEKACVVYRKCFGSNELCQGDFVDFQSEIPAHDVLTGGFPCQPFSSAGKKEGVRDARGTLFQHIVDVLRTHRPKYFVLENVKRLLTMEHGEHFATILGALAELDYFVEWRLLNAINFGLPQNRERVFIIGELASKRSHHRLTETFSPVKLASATDLKCLKDKQYRLFHTSEWKSVDKHKRRFEDWGIAYKGAFFSSDLQSFSAASPAVFLSSVLEDTVAPEFDFTEVTLSWIPNNTPVNRFVHGVEILSNQKGGARMGYTIFGINGVAPTLTCTTSRHYERYKIGNCYRRLTNIEYARIQGFSDNHCDGLSVYDQYALFGNAVPPPMAEWVIRQLTANGISIEELPSEARNWSLFDYA